MKNLWTVLPPPLSENFGFAEILEHSDGCGIVDDSGSYRLGSSRDNRHSFHNAAPEETPVRRPEAHRKHGGRGGLRTLVSGADEADVIHGTREKLMETFQNAYTALSPAFALFCAGPCGAMIGTDLGEIAETVSRQFDIPAAAVDISGQKAYDVGISKTLEAMVRLLPRDASPIPGTVNILGATRHDWDEADVKGVADWVSGQGFRVLACPGAQVTAEQMARMGSAQYNLVVTVAGLAAAKTLQARFGTPYLCMSPFGTGAASHIQAQSTWAAHPSLPADTLVISEQFAANAVREAVERKSIGNGADVATFFLLDRTCAREGDRRIRSEDEASALLNGPKYRCIIADPLLRPLLKRDCRWIDLPHRALNLYKDTVTVSLLGSNMDNWLETNG